MPIHGKISRSDVFAAQRLHYRPKAPLALLLATGSVVMLWYGYATKDWWLFFLPIYICVFFAVYMPLRVIRIFKQHKALAEAMTIELRSDGVFFQAENSSGLLPWAHIHKWKSNERMVLLYRTATMYHLIPTAFFSSSEERGEFTRAIQEKCGAAA